MKKLLISIGKKVFNLIFILSLFLPLLTVHALSESVTVTFPFANTELIRGQNYRIDWDYEGNILTTDLVDIIISLENQDSTIKSWTENFSATNEYFEWEVPVNQQVSNNYKIKLRICRPDFAQNACVTIASEESGLFSISELAPEESDKPISDVEKKYRERILQLNYQISEIEKKVTELERKMFEVLDNKIIKQVSGKILLQVEEGGEAWYVDPITKKKFYLKDGKSAYVALNAFGLGITNQDLAKIPIGIENRFKDIDTDGDGLPDNLEKTLGTDLLNPDTDGDGYLDGSEVINNYNPLGSGRLPIDLNFANRLKGRILLQIESSGQAWYVNPFDGKRYYLKDGNAAYQIMRFLSLGITNDNLRKIEVGDFKF